MKIISRLKDQRFCAFCRSPRRVYTKKHVDLTNVVAAIALTGTLTQAYYGQPDPRGLLIFCLVMGIAETFVYLRWRSFVVCKLCGFDPVLYKKSPLLASQRVREFYAEQAKNPSFLLSKSPLVGLHRRQVELERQQRKYEGVLPAFAGKPKTPVVSPSREIST